jgi:hypothetical protein
MTLLARARRRPLLSAAFVVALLLTLFFAVRLVVFSVIWSDPVRRNQPLAGWMTPGYVAHSWRVPPDVIATTLAPLTGDDFKGRSLSEIARQTDTPLPTLLAELEAAIAAHRVQPAE